MCKLTYEESKKLKKDAKTLSDMASMLEKDGRFVVLPSILNDISGNLNRLIRSHELCGSRKDGADDAELPEG